MRRQWGKGVRGAFHREVVCLALASSTTSSAEAEDTYSPAVVDSDDAHDATGSEPYPRFNKGYFTGYNLWAAGKAVPGIELSLGSQWFRGSVEAALLIVTDESSDFTDTFLGNQLGFYAEVLPWCSPHFELGVGLSADAHWLWGVNSAVTEWAFAPRASLRVFQGDFALSFSVRYYLLETEGLELGTTPSGREGLPVILGTGLTYAFELNQE